MCTKWLNCIGGWYPQLLIVPKGAVAVGAHTTVFLINEINFMLNTPIVLVEFEDIVHHSYLSPNTFFSWTTRTHLLLLDTNMFCAQWNILLPHQAQQEAYSINAASKWVESSLNTNNSNFHKKERSHTARSFPFIRTSHGSRLSTLVIIFPFTCFPPIHLLA